MPKMKLALLAVVVTGFFVAPSVASAACNLPTPAGYTDSLSGATTVEKSGVFGPEIKGKFVQIPFTAPAGATGMRIRYCYDNLGPDGLQGTAETNADNTTLDLGVYEPNAANPGTFTMNQRRGWSGSAVRIVGIGENGFTDAATYGTTDSTRKAYKAGRTTRAYEPGPIPAGDWAVELGGGYIDSALLAGADWKVEVTFTSDPAWNNDPYEPDPYLPNVANPAAGWYTGDFHVHGEEEPGNALMENTFDLAFNDLPADQRLDFLTLVDHNNDVARGEIGRYQAEYPGKLIIPGTEMTTYDGHFNSQNSNEFIDFRLGAIKKFVDANSNDTLDSGELQDVRGPENPSDRFAKINNAGGWAQINHPKIFETSPAACRGCTWTYDDSRTDFSSVKAIELQTGLAGIPAGSTTPAMNPFTAPAVAYYEHALATGAHIAAVGSSDDHKAGGANGIFDSSVGHGATVVHANQLSQAGITAAVKAGHTYVKPFGADAPDVELRAGEPGKADLTALPGDSVTGKAMNIQIEVTGAASNVRPGPYTLQILKNGIPVDSIAVTGNEFRRNYTAEESGRYSFKLTRLQGLNTMLEAYSTPVWFTSRPVVVPPTCETDPSLCPKPPVPSNRFRFGAVKYNKKQGTAQLRVRVASPGTVRLVAKNVIPAAAKVRKANQTITLKVRTKGKLKKALKKRGRAKVKLRVTNRPTGGKAKSAFKVVKLKQAKKKKRR